MYLANYIVIECIVVFHIILLSHGMHVKNLVSRNGCQKTEIIAESTVGCMPRLQVVPIPRSESFEVFYPNSVEVRRCSGSCSNMHDCIATVTTTRCFEIYNKIKHARESREVEEHLECGCCELTSESCNENQSFDEIQCRCQCTNDEERKYCRQGQYWDARNCVCVCGKSDVCESNQTWSEKYCGCIVE